MKTFRQLRAIAAVSVLVLSGCGSPQGQPRRGAEHVAPNEILEFGTLYAGNCAGCHGPGGRGGAATALANPVYLAIVDDTTMRAVIAKGVRGTSMPAFAQRSGGTLTDHQIDVIAREIRTRWDRRDDLDGATPPPYATRSIGDPERGADVYLTYCEVCHGRKGQGGPEGSAITNDAFLALISDQGLRTAIIAGRPDVPMHDWRGYIPRTPMSDQQVSDVVAWLASHRVRTPGRPYFGTNDLRR